MSSRTVRSYRRRKTNLELDLNRVPDEESREEEQEPPSTQLVPMIDVDAIDDDDVARNNSRRIRERTVVDVEDSEDRARVGRKHDRCREPLKMPTFFHCGPRGNLEGSSSSVKINARKSPEPPPPAKEPVFNCPICMGPLKEEMSTRCGHIFCKHCIKAAIASQGKCPTCRKKVTVRELIRVFLPSAS
ncbi:uncharacterized protein LOC133292583 isoform X2 [Gastrolobium bilobum]|uniref:uncharacterized protein LOC133292583 isoform X2 n=1 Tax=Gastrolobium bilobum TaxID=150636 RepID=UPI002AB05241|nr:uncharacterized protein LOC133292583 isoform X2 [Gastrolobium bilobum]